MVSQKLDIRHFISVCTIGVVASILFNRCLYTIGFTVNVDCAIKTMYQHIRIISACYPATILILFNIVGMNLTINTCIYDFAQLS